MLSTSRYQHFLPCIHRQLHLTISFPIFIILLESSFRYHAFLVNCYIFFSLSLLHCVIAYIPLSSICCLCKRLHLFVTYKLNFPTFSTDFKLKKVHRTFLSYAWQQKAVSVSLLYLADFYETAFHT